MTTRAERRGEGKLTSAVSLTPAGSRSLHVQYNDTVTDMPSACFDAVRSFVRQSRDDRAYIS